MLSWRERATFLSAVLLLPCMAAGVRLFGLRRCQTFLLKHSSGSSELDPPLQQIRVRSTARLVRAAAAHGLHRGNCLQQSLSLWWLLRRQGITSQLRIGMQEEENQIKGHAWVEYEGAVLNDEPDVRERFTCLGDHELPLHHQPRYD